MISICLTKFNNKPWEKVMMKGFKDALSTMKSFCNVEEIYGYPEKKYDLIILIGVRPIYKLNLDKNKIVPFCKKIIEIGDHSMDPRRTFEDAYFYFTPAKEKLFPHYYYLPKFVLEEYLYPEPRQTDILNVYVDHFNTQKSREESISAINKVFKDINSSNVKMNIFYHTSKGIEINRLNPEIPEKGVSQCALYIPFEKISYYYRLTDIFLPTHRESQGMVAQEIGACGGITVLQDWMYPETTHHQFPSMFYKENQTIDFSFIKDVLSTHSKEQMRKHVLECCGFENFKIKLYDAITNII